MRLASEDVYLGDDKFPQRPYRCEHIREAHGFTVGVLVCFPRVLMAELTIVWMRSG